MEVWEPRYEIAPESSPTLVESAVALEPGPSSSEKIDEFLERHAWSVAAAVLTALLGFILISSRLSGSPLFHWDPEARWESSEWELDKLERRAQYPQVDPRYRRQRPGGPGRSRWDDTTA